MTKKRLPYRIGGGLPKWLRIPYYILLWITAIYAIYRFTRWVLESIQKLGAFIFDTRNYWTVMLSIAVILIGSLIVSQFWLGLDPIGKTGAQIKTWLESITNLWGN